MALLPTKLRPQRSEVTRYTAAGWIPQTLVEGWETSWQAAGMGEHLQLTDTTMLRRSARRPCTPGISAKHAGSPMRRPLCRHETSGASNQTAKRASWYISPPVPQQVRTF